MKFDSIIFDLDGTLWNAIPAFSKSWNPVLEKYPVIKHFPTDVDYEGVMGLEPAPLMKKLFPYLDWKDAEPIWKEACAAELDYLNENGGILYNQLEDMLKKLSQHVKLMIVSNCNDGYIESFLHAHQLKAYFTDIECAGRTGLSKGENIKLIAERNRLENPVYVGDTMWDYEAACAAAIPFIHAAYGFGQVPSVPAIAEPLELVEFILNKQE